jgi:hypothetical protein
MGIEGIEVIDILVVVDAETIMAKYDPGSVDAPTSVSGGLIYMVVNASDAVSGQAGAELKIKAQTEDIIRWRETTLSLNGENAAILYKFVPSDPKQKLIREPRPDLVELKTPLPNEDAPTKPDTQTIKDYFWQTTVERAGDLTYHFYFMIVHRDGTIKGYYKWDPYIHITE